MNSTSIFLTHPNHVCMTYSKHAQLSLYFAYKFALASIHALIHAMLPFCYETSTSTTLKHIHTLLQSYGCHSS